MTLKLATELRQECVLGSKTIEDFRNLRFLKVSIISQSWHIHQIEAINNIFNAEIKYLWQKTQAANKRENFAIADENFKKSYNNENQK